MTSKVTCWVRILLLLLLLFYLDLKALEQVRKKLIVSDVPNV